MRPGFARALALAPFYRLRSPHHRHVPVPRAHTRLNRILGYLDVVRRYGDNTPTTPLTKILTMIFLPMAVAVLTQTLGDIRFISLRRAIRQTDYGEELAGQFLVAECVRCETADESITEAEFLVQVLLSRGIVVRARESNHHQRPGRSPCR